MSDLSQSLDRSFTAYAGEHGKSAGTDRLACQGRAASIDQDTCLDAALLREFPQFGFHRRLI